MFGTFLEFQSQSELETAAAKDSLIARLEATITAKNAQIAELKLRPTLEQIQDLRAGSLIFEADTANRTVKLDFKFEKTENLQNWQPLTMADGGILTRSGDGGTVTRILPLKDGKKIVRITLE